MGTQADITALQAHRTYPTRNTPAQQDILARGRVFLADSRALRKLGNEGRRMVFILFVVSSASPSFVSTENEMRTRTRVMMDDQILSGFSFTFFTGLDSLAL